MQHATTSLHHPVKFPVNWLIVLQSFAHRQEKTVGGNWSYTGSLSIQNCIGMKNSGPNSQLYFLNKEIMQRKLVAENSAELEVFSSLELSALQT